MNKSNKPFREKLLDIEKPNTNYRQKYEKEIQEMFEKKLNYLWRIGFAVLAVVGLVATIRFGTIAFSKISPGVGGVFIRITTIPATFLALAWTILMTWVTIKGKLNLRSQPPYMAGIGIVLGFFLIAVNMFIFVIPVTIDNPVDWRSILGTQLALIGFFFLVTIGFCVMLRVLYRTEFSTREKLLEIEYRIAELAEKLEGKPGK